MEEPDFWDVPERSQQHMKTLSDLKEDVATYKKLQDQYEEIELMIEMGYEENDPDIVPEIEEMLQNFQEKYLSKVFAFKGAPASSDSQKAGTPSDSPAAPDKQ